MCGSPDENVILNDGKKIDQLIDHYIFESVEKMLSNISLSTFENWYNEIEPSVGKVKELKEWAMKLYDEIRSEEVNQKRLKLEFSRLILKMDKKLNTAEAQPNGLKKPVIIKRDNGSIYREAQIG